MVTIINWAKIIGFNNGIHNSKHFTTTMFVLNCEISFIDIGLCRTTVI